MATGDLAEEERVRFESNERLDLPDADGLSRNPIAGLLRALTGAAPLVAGAPMPAGVGWVLSNPFVSSPGAWQVTVEGDPAFIGIDGNGQLMLSTVDLTINVPTSAGDYYIYAFRDEDPATMAVRRKVPAVGPFTEYSQSMNTRYRGRCRLYVSDVLVVDAAIDSAQRALVCIGLATFNSGGTMTAFTGTDNRMSTILDDPFLFTYPASAAESGSIVDIFTQSKALLGLIQDLKWAGAAAKHTGNVNVQTAGPTAKAVNYHAYKKVGGFRPSGPKEGLEETNRRTSGTITIGDGMNTFGKVDATDYASVEAMLEDILSVDNAVYYLKPGTVLTMTGDANVATCGQNVVVTTDGIESSVLDFNNHTLNIESANGLVFENLSLFGADNTSAHLLTTNTFWQRTTFRSCHISSKDASAFYQAAVTDWSSITFEDCTFTAIPTSSAGKTEAAAISFIQLRQTALLNCKFENTTGYSKRLVSMQGVGDGIKVDHCSFESAGATTGTTSTEDTEALLINSSDDPAYWNDRVISNCKFAGVLAGASATARPEIAGLSLSDCQGFEVVDCTFSRVTAGVKFVITTLAGVSGSLKTKITNNTFSRIEGKVGAGIYCSFNTTPRVFYGLNLDDNIFEDVAYADAIWVEFAAGPVAVDNMSICDNTFNNICADTNSDFSGRFGAPIRFNGSACLALRGLSVDGNKFYNCRNGAVGVLGTSATQIRNISISDNTFYIVGNDSTALLQSSFLFLGTIHVNGAIVVEAGSIDGVAIDNNKIDSVFSGTVPGGVGFLAFAHLYEHGGGTAQNVSLNDNRGSLLGSSSNSCTFVLIVLDNGANIDISENKLGSSDSYFTPASINGLGAAPGVLTNVRFKANAIRCAIATGSVYGLFIDGQSNLNVQGLCVDDNAIRGEGSIIWNANMLTVQLTTGILGLGIRNNLVTSPKGWPSPASVTLGRGINLAGASVRGYDITGNIAVRLDSAADGSSNFTGPFHANIDGGPATSGASDDGAGTNGYYVGEHADSTPTGGPARNRGWK